MIKFITNDGNGKLIDQIDEYQIWYIGSFEAAKQIGRFYKGCSAKWCIVTDNGEYYWNNDHKNDTFYFLIRKELKNDNFDKLAFEFKSNNILKVWDINNRKNTFNNQIVIEYMQNNFKWINKITDGEKYFKTPNLKIIDNDDGTVNIQGDIYLEDNDLTELPWISKFKVKYLFGDLNLSYNNLLNLNGLPEIINGDLYLNDCGLITLQQCTKKITGNCDISNNKLTSFEYGPTNVGGYLNISNNENRLDISQCNVKGEIIVD